MPQAEGVLDADKLEGQGMKLEKRIFEGNGVFA
jgi:hypothetical protein